MTVRFWERQEEEITWLYIGIGKKTIGFCTYTITCASGWLWTINKGYQNQGYGKLLFAELFSRLRTAKVRDLRLVVLGGNTNTAMVKLIAKRHRLPGDGDCNVLLRI
jgi:ribosomal protein S18 acetylase RimI-like enzyme